MRMQIFANGVVWVSIVALFVATGCASRGGISGNQSNSDDGSRGSEGSGSSREGGGGTSDGSSATRSESKGSSDSHSETTGTVTTPGKDSAASGVGGLLVTTGLLLLGASTVFTVSYVKFWDWLLGFETNRRDIRMDFARGQGPFIDEIAQHLELSTDETIALGALLKRSRVELDALLAQPEPLDESRATAFLVRLVEVIRAEPLFGSRVDAVMAQLSQAPGAR